MSEKKKEAKPGETVDDSGIYKDKNGKRTTLVKGKTAPPTAKPKQKHKQDVDTNPEN